MGAKNSKTLRQKPRARALFHGDKKYKLLVGVIFVSFVIGAVLLAFAYMAPAKTTPPPINDSRIGTDDLALREYIKSHGADQAITQTKTLPVDCHQRVHKIGRISYELFGNKAFTTLNSECMSGYTHGVTEAYFHKHGTDNLSQNLGLICNNNQSNFYAHQCFHGVGHGLMAYNDYDLPVALKSCDTLPPIGTSLESCYSGVFMENVVGAVPVNEAKAAQNAHDFHASSWLNDDPLFPCTATDTKYKQACYSFQTSRMLRIPNFGFQNIAAACSQIEVEYQSTCFSSMGRDVSSRFGGSFAEIEQACKYTENLGHQLSCIDGASQDKFWHENQQDQALAMCKAMQSAEFKQACYTTLSARGSEIIGSHANSQAFCAKFESSHKHLCPVKP